MKERQSRNLLGSLMSAVFMMTLATATAPQAVRADEIPGQDSHLYDLGASPIYANSGDPLGKAETQTRRLELKALKARCGSNSHASYAIDLGNSDDWLIVLPGGGYCYSADSCAKRAPRHFKDPLHDRGETSVNEGGIISDYAEWNVVKITYCTQDLYAGKAGQAIVREVVENIPTNQGSNVLIVGQSAGAVGIASNLNVFESIEASKINYLFDGYMAIGSTTPTRSIQVTKLENYFSGNVTLPTPDMISELDGFVILNKYDRVIKPAPLELREALAKLDHYSLASADHVMSKNLLWLKGEPSPAAVVSNWLETGDATYSE